MLQVETVSMIGPSFYGFSIPSFHHVSLLLAIGKKTCSMRSLVRNQARQVTALNINCQTKQ